MNHESVMDHEWIHNRDRMFFAKTLIERTPKIYFGKHPPTQNHLLVVIFNQYWSTSKYQVKRKQYVYLGQN